MISMICLIISMMFLISYKISGAAPGNQNTPSELISSHCAKFQERKTLFLELVTKNVTHIPPVNFKRFLHLYYVSTFYIHSNLLYKKERKTTLVANF